MLYPNPTTGILSLYRDNIDVPVYIKVMDSSGKILIESNESTVDISQYPQGLYFVESYLGGKVSIHKVIKE